MIRILNQLLKQFLVFAIRAYQYVLSPLWLPCCRFEPSCSTFALEAIRQHGPWRGMALACQRLLKCHPFHPGGYDPVPQVDQSS